MPHIVQSARWGALALGLVLAVIWGVLPTSAQPEGKLRVVATTTIVGDVVRQVAGDRIDLSITLPVNADAHVFEPVPRDVTALAEADVVFANGFDFEERLVEIVENLDEPVNWVEVSAGVTPRRFGEGEVGGAHAHGDEGEAHDDEDESHDDEGEAHDDEDESHEDEDEGAIDAHVWMDPNNVIAWVGTVRDALIELDPANADAYRANAQLYRAFLVALDGWIKNRVAAIPPQQRLLVTDHDVYGYYAQAYGFELVGTVIPNVSTAAEPSARDLAEVEEAIRDTGAKAIFVGTTVNPALSRQVAEDTGVELVFVFTGSLSEPGGPASTYLDYMRYNTNAIVEALK